MSNLGDRRVGRFDYALEYDGQLEIYAQVFQKMGLVPLRVEHRYDKMCFDVIGCSHYFDMIDRGSEPIDYVLTVIVNDDGEVVDVSVDRRDGKKLKELT